jgi:hypothetical protein
MTAEGNPPTPDSPVTVTSRVAGPDAGHIRYRLSNGWFIDHDKAVGRRHVPDMPFTVWAPGAGPDGIAAPILSETTLTEALAALNRRFTPEQLRERADALRLAGDKIPDPAGRDNRAAVIRACDAARDLDEIADDQQGVPRLTVKQLLNTPNARILITDRRECSGGGHGEWRAARTVRQPSWAMQDREPVGVHAATVERVQQLPGPKGRTRYNVVTNLGTVKGVTASQQFRLAPEGMRDSADIRAEMRADRERREQQEAFNRANPRDVDGVNVAPGELVELIDQGGGGRAGRPVKVVRAIRPCPLVGIVIARPYSRPYGDMYGAGEGLAIADGFRRLADQSDGPTARRSCGCPTTIRDAIIPPPTNGVDGWGAAIRHRDEMDAEDGRHQHGCPWADDDARPAQAVRFMDECDEDGGLVHVAHAVAGTACGHGLQYAGRVLDVTDIYSPSTLLWYLYPPAQYPDRSALPGTVRLADCIEPEAVSAVRCAAERGALAIVSGPHAASPSVRRCDVGGEQLDGPWWLLRSVGRGWEADRGASCATHASQPEAAPSVAVQPRPTGYGAAVEAMTEQRIEAAPPAVDMPPAPTADALAQAIAAHQPPPKPEPRMYRAAPPVEPFVSGWVGSVLLDAIARRDA